MTKKVAILYASVDGQTKKICDRIAQVLNEKKISTTLCEIQNFDTKKIVNYDTILIGAHIRYGKHSESVTNFIQNHKKQLEDMNTAFFSVNLVARKATKNSVNTNPYMIKFLKKINWKADVMEVFAGKLDYEAYSFWDRLMIKLIMKMTKGPTRTDKPIEYTDWNRVNRFANDILALNRSNDS